MKAVSQSRWLLIAGLPALILFSSTCIAFSTVFKQNSGPLAPAIALDLCLVMPFIYFLAIRKTSISNTTTLRVVLVGLLATGFLIPDQQGELYKIVKTWLTPVIELSLVGFVVHKFYQTSRKAKASALVSPPDFLTTTKDILYAILGSRKASTLVATEIAVFYYALFCKPTKPDNTGTFSSYKTNSLLLVLGTFLSLFIVETVGLHFILALWNPLVAWIITGLSAYSCMQLYAHIRAIKARPTVITPNTLFLRNGLLGGEASIPLEQIEKIVLTQKQVTGAAVQKLALLKGLETHNLAIYLKEPVLITKAFGIERKACIILLYCDHPTAFLHAFNNANGAHNLNTKSNETDTLA